MGYDQKIPEPPVATALQASKNGFSAAMVVNFIDVFQLSTPLRFTVGWGSIFWELGLLKGVLVLSCALLKNISPTNHDPRDLKHLAYRTATLLIFQADGLKENPSLLSYKGNFFKELKKNPLARNFL